MVDKLEDLIVLARLQHFGGPAEACGVTQPTPSAGANQLETLLGVLLVQRESRFRGLTPEGDRVLVWPLRIVGDVRQDAAPCATGSPATCASPANSQDHDLLARRSG